MRVYHTTYAPDAILAQGFKDGRGYYLTDRLWTGLWLSDRPLDSKEGAKDDVVLAMDIPMKVLKLYEWVEEGKGYREFLFPAEIVNQYGPPRLFEDSRPVR